MPSASGSTRTDAAPAAAKQVSIKQSIVAQILISRSGQPAVTEHLAGSFPGKSGFKRVVERRMQSVLQE